MLKSLARPAPAPLHHDDDVTVRDGGKALHELPPAYPAFARGSHPAIPAAEPPPIARRAARSTGESIARLLYFVSGALLAGAVAVFGGQLWRDARRPPAPAIAPAPSAALAVIAANGRVELAGDRRGVTRIAGGAVRWAASQPSALDAIEVTGPLVLAHTADAIAALDLESGRTRFTWALPADERWAAQRPLALDDCLIAITTRGKKTVVRCMALTAGAVRWTAALTGAQDCTQPAVAVPGAYLVSCPGWTAVIDARNGAVSVEPGGVGLIQDKPPYLLRAGARLSIAPWSPTRRRFTSTGEIAYGTGNAASSSAVLYKGRLVARAVDSSDDLAIITPRDGAPIPVAAAVYRLADATPLVRSCGGETSPRFQLLELAPRIGATFDPAMVQDRALALLDVETGTLAWTSRKLSGVHHRAAAQPPICRGGHYFLPLEATDRSGAVTSALWVVDAETGKTAAAVAFDPELGAGFADLTADHVDGERLVGVGRGGAFELAWRTAGHGLHDARRELEAVLGPLP